MRLDPVEEPVNIGRMSRSVLQKRKARSIMYKYPYSSITLSSDNVLLVV